MLTISRLAQAQSLYVADSMEAPAAWRGTSTMVNSSFVGGLSSAVDNPPNYPMYASFDSCYMVKGIGLGSSAIEADTFTYPNLPVIAGKTYEIRFKVASFGLGYLSNPTGPAGVDGTDTLEFQFRLAASAWFRDCRILGNNNAMWSFNGAISNGANIGVSRVALTSPNSYAVNAANPITRVAVRLNPGTYSTIQIRFITKVNGAGETFMIDDVEVWDVTPTLPVELTYFTANCNPKGIELKWQTASETNNDCFKLYKSFDGTHYQLFAQIPGAGTTSELQNYSVVDEDVSGKIIYYKLVQFDYDGTPNDYDPIAMVCYRRSRVLDKIVNSLGQEINENTPVLKFYLYK